MCCPSATFAVWSSAWLHGLDAADDFLDAVNIWGPAQEFIAGDDRSAELFALPLSGEVPENAAQMLTSLRKNKIHSARLVLPAPGDVRGLAGSSPFTQAALETEEAVLLLDEAGIPSHGLVPRKITAGRYRWTLFTPDTAIADSYLSFKDAEQEFTAAVRESAESLSLLGIARDRPAVRTELAAHLRSLPELLWPASTPGAIVRILQRTKEIAAILWLANDDEPGGATSASSARLRSDTLRTLENSLRLARQAAVNEAVRVMTTASK